MVVLNLVVFNRSVRIWQWQKYTKAQTTLYHTSELITASQTLELWLHYWLQMSFLQLQYARNKILFVCSLIYFKHKFCRGSRNPISTSTRFPMIFPKLQPGENASVLDVVHITSHGICPCRQLPGVLYSICSSSSVHPCHGRCAPLGPSVSLWFDATPGRQ